MTTNSIIEKIFVVRAKDDLGQYLDDEQDWRSDMEYTATMRTRLEQIVRQNIVSLRSIIPADLDDEAKEWVIAMKCVEAILRRRGGEDFETFSKTINDDIKQFTSLNVYSKNTYFPDYEKW